MRYTFLFSNILKILALFYPYFSQEVSGISILGHMLIQLIENDRRTALRFVSCISFLTGDCIQMLSIVNDGECIAADFLYFQTW